jgi:hypothetical protein
MENKLVSGKPIVNPDESLAELYHQRRILSNDLSKAGTQEAKNKVYDAIDRCNEKIRKAENAMSNGSAAVRLF